MYGVDRLAIGIGAIAALLVLLGVHIWWRKYSVGKVLSEGVPTDAEVVGSRWRRNGTMVKFKYQQPGRSDTIITKRLLEGTFVTLRAGDRITLKYHPDYPKACVLVEFAGTHDAR